MKKFPWKELGFISIPFVLLILLGVLSNYVNFPYWVGDAITVAFFGFWPAILVVFLLLLFLGLAKRISKGNLRLSKILISAIAALLLIGIALFDKFI